MKNNTKQRRWCALKISKWKLNWGWLDLFWLFFTHSRKNLYDKAKKTQCECERERVNINFLECRKLFSLNIFYLLFFSYPLSVCPQITCCGEKKQCHPIDWSIRDNDLFDDYRRYVHVLNNLCDLPVWIFASLFLSLQRPRESRWDALWNVHEHMDGIASNDARWLRC